jgi:hypothetical protein
VVIRLPGATAIKNWRQEKVEIKKEGLDFTLSSPGKIINNMANI